MINPQSSPISYKEMRERQFSHMLRRSEIPIEYEVSLPLPTKRWRRAAYASFASPAIRQPDQLMRQEAPDRWWIMDAYSGRLLLYALWNVLPYAEGVQWSTVTLPPVPQSLAELQEKLDSLETLMETLAPSFFMGEEGVRVQRHTLLQGLKAYLTEPLYPQYYALTPDFFAWLEV
jgi:hypothetical protein